MKNLPWWIAKAEPLLNGDRLGTLQVGALWNLATRIQFIKDNVEPALLEQDLAARPEAKPTWSALLTREAEVTAALSEAVARLARSLREGSLDPESFRQTWEALGFVRDQDGAGTPADDYLDAISQVARLTTGEARPPSGMLNMASRAERISDFIAITKPAESDLVYDIGAGSGKFAVTVAASTRARVRGIEYGAAYVETARVSVNFLGLRRLEFIHADVRDVDLSDGTIFYLYYPFSGDVAAATARALGRVAEDKPITIYMAGPEEGFRAHFLSEPSLRAEQRRGEFDEVLVLRSRGG